MDRELDEIVLEDVPYAGPPQAGDDTNNVANPQAVAGGAGAGSGDAAAPPADGQEDPVAAAAQQAADDAEYLDKMRGWLMTVATLFVGMAFQAAMHPPIWMPKSYLGQFMTGRGEPASDSKTKHDAELAVRDGGRTVLFFITFNTTTFGIGLALLVTLLVMKKAPSRREMKLITYMVVVLAITAACTFACGMSSDPVAALVVLCFLATYAVWVWAFAALKGWFRGTNDRKKLV